MKEALRLKSGLVSRAASLETFVWTVGFPTEV